MIIKCSDEELQQLVELGVLKVKSKNEYYIETKPDIFGENHMILVNTFDSDDFRESSKRGDGKVLPVDSFLEAFPTPGEVRNMLSSINAVMPRTLKSGVKSKMQSKLVELSKRYTPIEILNVVKFEVKKRVETSLQTGRNELQFMQAAGSWLNNDANFESIFEEMNAKTNKQVGNDELNFL